MFFLNSTILKSSQQKARDQNHLVLLFTYFKVSEDLVKLPKCASTWCSWVETSKKSLNIDTLILIRWLAALNNCIYWVYRGSSTQTWTQLMLSAGGMDDSFCWDLMNHIRCQNADATTRWWYISLQQLHIHQLQHQLPPSTKTLHTSTSTRSLGCTVALTWQMTSSKLLPPDVFGKP